MKTEASHNGAVPSQVFSDLDFLGWYTTGEGPTESDIQVHRQVCCINESPVLLKLNPWGRHSQLPVAMYESVIDLVNGQATMLFVELPYTLATEEAERIGLDHMARMSAAGESGESSLVAQHLQVGPSHCGTQFRVETWPCTRSSRGRGMRVGIMSIFTF